MRNVVMSGLVVFALGATGAALAATHTVTQSNLTFSPASLTISVGDTVQWVWTAGTHTVTSGTGGADPDAGALFDSPLTTDAPLFEYVFTTAGTVPYFCRPHETFGMTGTIVVTAASGVPANVAPAVAELLPNWPNPFNPRTLIRFSLPEPSTVTLRIHDLRGRQVRLLADGEAVTAGRHGIAWDGRDDTGRASPAGVYLAVLNAGGVRLSRPVALVK